MLYSHVYDFSRLKCFLAFALIFSLVSCSGGDGGVSGDGQGATPVNMSYINGKTSHKINNENLVDELEAMVRTKVANIEAAKEAEQATEKTG